MPLIATRKSYPPCVIPRFLFAQWCARLGYHIEKIDIFRKTPYWEFGIPKSMILKDFELVQYFKLIFFVPSSSSIKKIKKFLTIKYAVWYEYWTNRTVKYQILYLPNFTILNHLFYFKIPLLTIKYVILYHRILTCCYTFCFSYYYVNISWKWYIIKTWYLIPS